MSEQVSHPQGLAEARVPGPEPGAQPAAAGPGAAAVVPPSPETAEPAVEVPRLQSGLKGCRLARPDPGRHRPTFHP